MVLVGLALTLGLGAHKLHLSHSRMAVEGDRVVMRMRFFRHDLEDALKAYHDVPQVVLAPTVRSDSLFMAYLGRRLTLAVDDDTLLGQIISSGEDRDIWWYELSFRSTMPIEDISIENQLLFDLFDDQKNIVYVTHFPSEQRETLYCVSGSARYQITFEMQ